MALSSLLSNDQVDRVDSGEGYIHEHSLEIGNTVIAIHNIGSMTIISDSFNWMPIVWAAILGMAGIIVIFFNTIGGILLILAAGVIAFIGFSQQPNSWLSIGICDGRAAHLVSKDREFLLEVRRFLREKIDLKSSSTGTVNITAGTISGGVAVGSGAKASGRSGNIEG